MRVNIVEEVERHVRLQKAGRSYKGLSPFTTEKSPSFFVNPDKGAFYCFSTAQGGDVIRFVEMVEHLPFFEAVEVLAQRHNVTLEYESGGGPSREERSRRAALLEMHEQARAYYHQCFMANDQLAEKVREYWTQKRRFSLEVAKEFSIGFDPPGSDALMKKLLGAGHSPELLLESGLFTTPDESPDLSRMRSRFRGRLTIPIREASQGQVIAFTARELFCTPGADSFKLAKYVNSPGTPLFHKSRVLFNLERAQKSVRDDPGGFIMVEGQLDAIRCFTSGFASVVAPQGTSITEEQLLMLKRYSDRARILLDGDAAGQRAALRVLPMCFAAGLEPSFVELPAGQDPDSLLAGEGGADALRAALASAMPPMQFAARALLADPENEGPRGRAQAMKKAGEILASVESEVARQAYLVQLCDLMKVDYQAARADLQRMMIRSRSSAPEAPAESAAVKENVPSRLTSLESDLWCLVFQDEKLACGLYGVVDEKWMDSATVEGRLLCRLFWELREGLVDSVAEFVTRTEDRDELNFLYSLQIRSADTRSEDVLRDAENIIRQLYVRHRKQRLEAIDRIIETGSPDRASLESLLRERVLLVKGKKELPALTIQG